MTPYNLFENALVILDLMQLVIKGLVLDFFTFKKFLDLNLIKDRDTAEEGFHNIREDWLLLVGQSPVQRSNHRSFSSYYYLIIQSLFKAQS